MLHIRISLALLILVPSSAVGHFPIPPTSDGGSGANQGRQHKMELEHVQITKEMENKILDEIDQRLSDLEDIDVDAKILERHMDKHPNFQGYESSVNTLNSIEERVLYAYKVELNLMKRRIIASNHDLKVNEMEDMNLLLDNAEVTVNKTRGMIDNFIDVHAESEEHQHEHDHSEYSDDDHDDHDSFEDYSDLLTNETEATDEEESLIVNTIERGLEELDQIRNHRGQLEEHLQDHRDSQDHVNTNFAESILEEIQVSDVEDYKDRLQELRRQVGEAKGHVKIDFVDKIVSTLERANIFVEVSKNRLHIADELDDEASNNHKDDAHHHEAQADETKDEMDNVDEEEDTDKFGGHFEASNPTVDTSTVELEPEVFRSLEFQKKEEDNYLEIDQVPTDDEKDVSLEDSNPTVDTSTVELKPEMSRSLEFQRKEEYNDLEIDQVVQNDETDTSRDEDVRSDNTKHIEEKQVRHNYGKLNSAMKLIRNI